MTLIIFVCVKYLLHLAYKGTNYHGWQRQKNTSHTIQEILESKISMLTQQNIALVGCGRTDKGVHASQYFAHFTANEVSDKLVYKLNRVLPNDIVAYELIKVNENFNSRFDAQQRTYRYFFHLKKEVMKKELSTLVELGDLNLSSTMDAIAKIPLYNDFGSFCKAPDKLNNTLCNIHSAVLYGNKNEDSFCFEIAANRFLRGMIRILMHRLLNVLSGRMSVDEFESYLQVNRSPTAVEFAFPQGLFLYKIAYANVFVEGQKSLDSFLFDGLSRIEL